MKHMSFAVTTEQIRNRTKTVTRRLRWTSLQPGTLLQPIVKGQGLKKGERVEKLGDPIRVVSVRRERIDLMETDQAYGYDELKKEGYPLGIVSPAAFVNWFQIENRFQRDSMVTRIEFEYVRIVNRQVVPL